MWRVIQMKTWLLSLKFHSFHIHMLKQRIVWHCLTWWIAKSFDSVCGSNSQSFVLSNLFLWDTLATNPQTAPNESMNAKASFDITTNFHKFAIKTKFNVLHILAGAGCCYIQWELSANKRKTLLFFFSSVQNVRKSCF